MKITALVENQSNCELKAKSGLSLYIETSKHKILFDVGMDNTLFRNSDIRGIDLSKVDTVMRRWLPLMESIYKKDCSERVA